MAIVSPALDMDGKPERRVHVGDSQTLVDGWRWHGSSAKGT